MLLTLMSELYVVNPFLLHIDIIKRDTWHGG